MPFCHSLPFDFPVPLFVSIMILPLRNFVSVLCCSLGYLFDGLCLFYIAEQLNCLLEITNLLYLSSTVPRAIFQTEIVAALKVFR